MTFFGEYYFTNFGEYIFENLSKSSKLSQILVTKFLKISLIQQNFHQFWWKNMCKIIIKYCHRFRWNFHHLTTHYFLWFTKKITRIGENSAKNSSENQDGLLPRIYSRPSSVQELLSELIIITQITQTRGRSPSWFSDEFLVEFSPILVIFLVNHKR